MNGRISDSGFLLRFILLLLGLSLPFWLFGAAYDVQLFPGFNLYQFLLAMPAVAAMLLVARQNGRSGIVALLKRTYDFRKFRPPIWLVPVLLIYPSIGFINYWILRLSGTDIPQPEFSLVALFGYSVVFFLTYSEELGLTGYLIDRLQQRYSALTSSFVVGIVWAAYHIPGFAISGYYSEEWIFWHATYTIVGRVLFVWVYNNSGRSLFSMALLHSTLGVFWILWPATGNLQKATSYYDPRVAALAAAVYVAVVVLLWGPKTLAQFRFARTRETV